MEQKNKSGGRKCGVKYCKNTTGVSFFTLPRDIERRTIWIKNCFMGELINNINNVTYRRVCQDHFENKMFLNINQKNRLTHFAVPTLFNDEILSKRAKFISVNEKNHLNLSSDEKFIKKTESEKSLDNQSSLNIVPLNGVLSKIEDTKILIDNNSHSNITIYGTTPNKTKDVVCQTPLKFDQIENTMKQLKLAKKRIKDLELQVKKFKLLQNDPVKKFLNSCQNMLSPNLNFIIKSHLMCKQRKVGKAFRYSNEMKEFALSIYFISPKAYNFIKTNLSLPSISTLKRITTKSEFINIKTKFKKLNQPRNIETNNYKQSNFEFRLQDIFPASNTESNGIS